jgi:concanavalin A-like lectin/glucanase superfamily protein
VRPDFDFSDPLAIINLDATDLPAGALPVWTNSGALPGNFQSDAQAPAVTTAAGVRGVTFDGTNNFYTGPLAPVYMTRTNSRTIEAWIHNPVVATEETIFSWSRRGGPDGSNLSFNHGTDPVFGAAGHWGPGPDVGWSGNISTGRWTFVAYTYDHATRTVRVFKDGQQANTEVVTNIMTHSVDTVLSNGLPFRVAAQNEANGSATLGLRGSMTIARIRVYDEALTAQDIAARFNSELPFFIPRLSITYDAGSGTATITWLAVDGRTYTVDSSNDLVTWNERATAVATGSFVDNQAGSSRFYRIRLE